MTDKVQPQLLTVSPYLLRRLRSYEEAMADAQVGQRHRARSSREPTHDRASETESGGDGAAATRCPDTGPSR